MELDINDGATSARSSNYNPRAEAPTRPNSLLLPEQPLQPEKEPLKFDVNLVGAPLEVEQLVNNIKQVAEEFLYHWKTFPIVLPPPACTVGDGVRQKPLNLQDLFVAPSFDELDAVAVDCKGEPRRLAGKQLDSIRERGEFEVASRNFPGQCHVWRLSPWLQAGRARARDTALHAAALAASLLLVTARARLVQGAPLSLHNSCVAFVRGLNRLLDILLGMPCLVAHNLESKIREERCRYLVAELVCKPEHRGDVSALCGWVSRALRRAATEKVEVGREWGRRPLRVPYLYTTPQRTDIDLRLFKRDIMRRALPTLSAILERESRGWFLHYRERLVHELRKQKMPDTDIEQEVCVGALREYVARVSAGVRASAAVAALGPGVAELLAQQLQATVLMRRAVDNVQRKLEQNKQNLRERLETTHPIRSRIEPWMEEKLRLADVRLSASMAWAAHEEAAATCAAHQLTQHAYFLQRDLAFMKEREPILLKELKKVKTPTRTFKWSTQIWFPSAWVVRRHFQGACEVLPTVLTGQVTSITTPRSDPSQPVFLVEKEVVRTTTTQWPMWRWINYCHRTWCWSWNAMFLLGVVIPWCSPLSLRALCCVEPFIPDLELSQVNGTLFPRKSSMTPTVCSRLVTLWRHISKSRTQFETKPDTGFIGKGMTRHMNRVWNYAVKGTLGTLLLLVLFPLVCLLTSALSLLAAVTTMLWMPALTLVLHLLMVLVYDMDCPDPGVRNRYFIVGEAIIWELLIKGCLQPVGAILVALVICPLAAFLILTFGCVGWAARLAWDSAMFQCVVNRRGRVPACDGAFARRVAGPGLAHHYYFQIRGEQALAALWARMELEELAALERSTESAVRRPQRDYAQFVHACFGPFSVQLAKSGPYKQLEKECNDLVSSLNEKLEKRRRELDLGLSESIRTKIKLSAADLKVTVQAGAKLTSRFYPSRVLARLQDSGAGADSEDWWSNKGLSPGDWPALTAQLLAEIFALDILSPLADEDARFRLEQSSNVDLSRYSEMIRDCDVADTCPDVVGGAGTWGGAAWAGVGTAPSRGAVAPPSIDVSAFSPRSRHTLHQKRGDTVAGRTLSWARVRTAVAQRTLAPPPPAHPAPRLPTPLPIPHPLTIAIIIYNRDADTPIPLELESCVDILRSLEDVACDADEHDIDGGSRYRRTAGDAGGAGDDGHTTASSADSLDTSASSEEEGEVEGAGDGGDRGEVCERETLPCQAAASYHWTLTNWAGGPSRGRKQSGSVRVDLASPEDVTLDTDSARVVFTNYGTSV